MADQPDKHVPPPDTSSPGDGQPPPGQAARPEKPLGWHEPLVEEGSSRPVVVDAWYTPENAVTEETVASQATPESAQEPLELPGGIPEQPGAWYQPLNAQLDALLAGAADTIIETHESKPPAAGMPRQPGLPAGAAAQPMTDTQPQPAADTQAQPASAEAQPLAEKAQLTGEPQAEPALEGGWSAPSAEAGPATTGEEVSTRLFAPEEAAPAAAEPAVPPGSTPVPQTTPPSVSRGLSPAEAAFLAEQRAAGLQPPAELGLQPTPATPTDGIPVPAAQPLFPGAPAAATGPSVPVQPPQPTPFDEVERKVSVLRQRFQAGYLTREELQNELRSQMILDDQGRWWMIGLESNKWYSYDGRDWSPGIPPGREQPVQSQAVRGNLVPTETGVQPVPAGSLGFTEETGPHPRIEIDEDGMPLPKRVPLEDPGATLVSSTAPFVDSISPSEALTLTSAKQIEQEGIGAYGAEAALSDQMTQPSAVGPGAIQQTLRSEPVRAGGPQRPAEPTLQGGQPVRPAPAAGSMAGEAISKPKPKIGEFPQPDYSEALGISRNRNTYVRWAIRISIFSLIGGMALTLIVLVGMVVYYFSKVNQYQDAVKSLASRASTFETTEIFAADGTELARFNDPNRGARESVPLEKISPWLLHATVSTENETFYTDPGFSVFGIVRATVQNLRAGNTVSGASTITQGLAKALVLETELASSRTAERKIIEIIVASEISRQYSKNEILQIYLNEIFYGNFAYGIEAAAQTYFGKSAADLNPAEAAFLAGLPQSPAAYDPVVNREAALLRMNDVLRLMSEANGDGCITIQHADATQWAIPNGGTLCVTAQTQADGSKVYYYQTPNMAAPEEMTLDLAIVQTTTFKPPQRQMIHPHFVNYVWQQLEDTYGAQAIYNNGFRVYTTLDDTIQKASEQAVTDQLSQLQRQGIDATNASVVVMRPSDGAVLAMVGSADYNNEQIDGQVNVAFTAQQPGSSIKPVVYLAAFEPDANGRYLTPATVMWDVPSDFGGYVPVNFDRLYHGPETVRFSLANSLNVPAVKAFNFIGMDHFMDMAQRVGLTFPLGDPVTRNAGLPTALGAVEVRLFDMVQAYGVLANNGRRVDPYAILYIQDSKGNEIYRANTSPQGLQVVQPEYAYLVTNILSDNEARSYEFGRGWPMELQNGRPAAVKTGTTDDSRDIWTIGYTPQTVVGVWVGNTDNRPVAGAYGYTGAAPIWNSVMEAAIAGQPIQQFIPPQGVSQATVCADSGAQPSPACASRTAVELFAAGAPPPGPDKDIFSRQQVDEFTGKLANDSCRDSMVTRDYLAIGDPTAYNWINNTGEGAQWAQARGLQIPLQPPPTEYCDPNQPRPNVVFATPPEGSVVQGIVPLRGALVMPDFNRYEIRYAVGSQPTDADFSQPFVVDTNQRPEGESLLGEFNTQGLPGGPYTLRLIVIDNFGRSVKRDIHVTLSNPEPTPVPTLAPAPPATQAVPPVATPFPGIATPTLAPTLTATWTLTPTPQ